MWKASAGNQAVSRISSQDKAQGAKNCGDRWPGWGGTVPPPRGRPCGRSPERLRRGRARSQHGTPRVPKTRFKLS